MRIFLSYAREDAARVHLAFELLQGSSFDPWMDTRSLVAGVDWEAELKRQIRSSDMFLLLMSQHSVNKRGIIQKEIRTALDKAEELLASDIYIVPVLLEPCEVPDSLQKFQWIDATKTGWEVSLIKSAIECQRQRYGVSVFQLKAAPLIQSSWKI